jgi:hypothetical protein
MKPKSKEQTRFALSVFTAAVAWLDPAITRLWSTMPADGWAGGVTLFDDRGLPVVFNSLAEMEAATLSATIRGDYD